MRGWIVAAALMLAACGTSDGANSSPAERVTREYALRDFDGVASSGPDRVTVRTGQPFAIRASGPADAVSRLAIDVDNSTLRIGRERSGNFRWSGRGDDGVDIVVTMPAIRRASLDGSGTVTVDGGEGDLAASVGGSGDLSIGDWRGGAVALSVAGSGTLAAAGNADRLTMAVSGSGDVDAERLSARSAEVSIVGSGDVRAAIDGPASVSIAGSGSADLGERARCTVTRAGSGEARCGS